MALSVAASLVHDPTHAEDLVHDAFVTVWREIHGYQGTDAALPQWVVALVHASAAESLFGGTPHRSRSP